MSRYIIRECNNPDFSFYFDGDVFSEAGGNYCYTLFCVTSHYGRYSSGINGNAFKDISNEMDSVLEEIDGLCNGWSDYENIKEIMKDYSLPYSPRKAHELKELLDLSDYIERLCGYLTIKTGHKWDSKEARGYCQGDYVEVVYCKDFYTNETIDIIGDLYFGCGKEFCIIDNEESDINTVYGYYVADCQGYQPDDYLRIVCEQEGIEPKEATLELIENIQTIYNPVYATYTL